MAFDATQYKSTTRQQWQDAAEAWNAWGTLLGDWLGQATETMLDMAAIGPGSRVLDVAAGAGQQSLVAARRVGPTGHVLATDISSNILDFAAENARIEGLDNLTTLVADGEALDLAPESFDAAISRVGMIYFPDQQRALANILRALKPGGRFAAIVYGPPEKNGFFSKPVSIIRERAKLPPPAPGQPGPFSLGAPGVLAKALKQAGFRDVEDRIVDAPVLLPSAAECVRFERDSFGALHQMLGQLDAEAQDSAWQAIEDALSAYETPSGFCGPCELIIAAGTK
ncbi:MAG: methyltransferase domain-containing protein [Pseudodonghicola sp.]|nr:methyltransferase domain-containing protein [Pseudodonghicola sp.]